MFLGIREMLHSKTKYLLIISVLMLITWLVVILSGLANGLAEGNRLAVDQWQAEGVIVSKEANRNLNVSTIKDDTTYQKKNSEPINQMSVSIQKAASASNKRTNVSFFGIQKNSSLLPKITAGRKIEKDNEIIASADLKEVGYRLGDQIKAGTYSKKLTIVGWTVKSTYNIVPVIYTNLETVRELKYGGDAAKEDTINAFIVSKKEKDTIPQSKKNEVEYLPIESFIQNLPGYSAQNLTLDTMIYFMLLIAAFISAIFIYVMTLQKTAMFGILKVQGVPTSFLVKSVMSQTLILALVGVSLGLILSSATIIFLPKSLPFANNIGEIALNCGLLIVVAALGGLASIGTIRKIKPLKAIGG